MGTLLAAHDQFEFNDRLLAHLKTVVTQNLRRREPFLLSWPRPMSDGSGRVTLWITEASQLHFRFRDGTPPALNRQWLEELTTASHLPLGLNLDVVPEPAAH